VYSCARSMPAAVHEHCHHVTSSLTHGPCCPLVDTIMLLAHCSSAAARSERRQALRNGTSATTSNSSSIGSSVSMQQQQHEHELIDERTDLFDAELSRIPEHRCVAACFTCKSVTLLALILLLSSSVTLLS
jgi:hypothetical protein